MKVSDLFERWYKAQLAIRDMSIADAARKVGAQPQNLWLLVKKAPKVNYRSLEKLASALDMTVGQMLGRFEEFQKQVEGGVR